MQTKNQCYTAMMGNGPGGFISVLLANFVHTNLAQASEQAEVQVPDQSRQFPRVTALSAKEES